MRCPFAAVNNRFNIERQWCLQEALRLRPTVTIVPRVLDVDDYQLHDVALPRGTIVFASLLALHTNVEQWGADADRYRPDRFSPEASADRHPFAFLYVVVFVASFCFTLFDIQFDVVLLVLVLVFVLEKG
jgi:hypothetical protein